MKLLPTKSKTSLDIPRLLSLLEKGPYDAQCQFIAVATVRNYMTRHQYPKRLSHAAIKDATGRVVGYTLSLKAPYDANS